MSLEVHIYGPGFGETIFLRWPGDDGRWRGGLVDAYSPQEGAWLADMLRKLELMELEFVVATHPHLDHIHNLAAGLVLSGVGVRRGFYWPGLSPKYWMQFFDRLANQKGGDLKDTATMIRQWFGFLDQEAKGDKLIPGDAGGMDLIEPIYKTTVNGTPLLLKAIGPWMVGMNRLIKNVSNSIDNAGHIQYEHRHANDVSIALLLEYGEAQVVLGGDMENVNWHALMRASTRPKFTPSLVKVSHHGSSNGRIEGMWPADRGFFEGAPSQAVAVVTPWRQGGGRLPEDAVLQEIKLAGFAVYVTGEYRSPRARPSESHMSIRVVPDGLPHVFEQVKVRIV